VTLYELRDNGAIRPAGEELTGIFGAADEHDCAVVRIPIDGPVLVRLWRLLWLRPSCRRAARRLRRHGVGRTRRFAVLPELAAPFLVYELGTRAAVYAADRLTLSGSGLVRRVMRFVSGCDPGAGAVLVIGARRR
jgi:hypothetical protein